MTEPLIYTEADGLVTLTLDRPQARNALNLALAAESAVTQLAEIKDRLTRLRAELHELETQEADARKAEKSTDRESRRLARVLDDARTRTAELERTVDELGG